VRTPAGAPGDPNGPGSPPPRRSGPRPRWGRIALVAGLALVLLFGTGTVLWYRSVAGNVDRTDPFSQISGGRPATSVNGALNILVVGSDSRDPEAAMDKASQWRADTVIMMHIPAAHDRAYLVSIPRDLWVPVPENAGGSCGGDRRAKINAAFAWGGLPLAVRTVECFTDVRIDHVLSIDFGGFKQVTDALGGVDLKVERSITSIHKPHRQFTEGTMHMNGEQALDWIRQRKQFPDGDFARMRHQQEFLRALMDKAASSGTLGNPLKLKAFLEAVSKAVTVDKDFQMLDMAWQFKGLRGDSLKFVTSPNVGSDTIGGQSVVVSDREKAIGLYKAMSDDKMAEWYGANVSPSPKPGS
jgi:LCP family protein required for cell wall assembly